jgi:hypothetical protein
VTDSLDGTLLVAVLGAVILLNLVATVAVVRNRSNGVRRKFAQSAIVWLVPVFGALICILFVRADAVEPARGKPREFFENADASGSDH